MKRNNNKHLYQSIQDEDPHPLNNIIQKYILSQIFKAAFLQLLIIFLKSYINQSHMVTKILLIFIFAICSSSVLLSHVDNAQGQLCSFNDIGFVPSTPDHVFYVTQIPTGNYASSNFEVTWKNKTRKDHPFFKKIGSSYNQKLTMKQMECEPADYKVYAQVCNEDMKWAEQNYKNAFGDLGSFKCKIPKGHFGIFTRFVLKLQNLNPRFYGRWAIFSGIHAYNSTQEAYNTIERQVKKLSRWINQTHLTTFQINSQLNIIPTFVAGSLSGVFNYYNRSNFVKNIQTKTPYRLNDEGFVKIIPAGTQFIYGKILNGTENAKQVCDNFTFPESNTCGFVGDNKNGGNRNRIRGRGRDYDSYDDRD